MYNNPIETNTIAVIISQSLTVLQGIATTNVCSQLYIITRTKLLSLASRSELSTQLHCKSKIAKKKI